MKSDKVWDQTIQGDGAWERLLQSMRVLGMDESKLPMAQRRSFAKLSLQVGKLPILTVSATSGESVSILGKDESKYQEILELWGIQIQGDLTSIDIDLGANSLVRWTASGLAINNQ